MISAESNLRLCFPTIFYVFILTEGFYNFQHNVYKLAYYYIFVYIDMNNWIKLYTVQYLFLLIENTQTNVENDVIVNRLSLELKKYKYWQLFY